MNSAYIICWYPAETKTKELGFSKKFLKVFFEVLMYKENQTQILRPWKNILYTILHVTSLLLTEWRDTDITAQKLQLKHEIKLWSVLNICIK